MASIHKDYANRQEAGLRLAEEIAATNQPFDLIVAVPRGGVEVAAPIAQRLKNPLALISPRKLAMPHQAEVAIGAIGPDGSFLLDESLIAHYGISREYIDAEKKRQLAEMERRRRDYPFPLTPDQAKGRRLLLVDDGVATGFTLRAAIATLQAYGPAYLAVALPVGPADTLSLLRHAVDRVHCPLVPEPFYAVGAYYEDFGQTSDETVRALLTGVNGCNA
ncbi:phosphoribosyltransferase [Heliobacterium gestii]|uniref:Phosphoribosyltransferase n=1 Tax=Heliomicrobium gestii TaxID=2699 RepID=A0A845LJ89_HELGE|nr:phosphoribosyltransferase family protein [Heliomicrobium gestii]MBM7868272.1 putative phosphoribosyltransferase [Heliomicrobium gestii]MZP44465.1 phosphoribosyltransferase [Heliomicrobium gestii]